MNKRHSLLLLAALFVSPLIALAAGRTQSRSLTDVAFSLNEYAADAAYTIIDAPALFPALEPEGAPALPFSVVAFTVREGASNFRVTFAADWSPAASAKTTIAPIQPPYIIGEDAPPFTPPAS